MIDDLISKGTNEPYRMFTSRAEFRLYLRIDNADRRLTPHARRLGLIADADWTAYEAKQARAAALEALLATGKPEPTAWQELLAGVLASTPANEDGDAPSSLTAANTANLTYAQLLRRPEVTLDLLWPLLRADLERRGDALFAPWLEAEPGTVAAGKRRVELKAIECEIKYAGYLQQQRRSIEKLKAAETRAIPADFRYEGVSGLSREMQEKLTRVRPSTIGQASRIPGITPAALTLLSVHVGAPRRRFDSTVPA